MKLIRMRKLSFTEPGPLDFEILFFFLLADISAAILAAILNLKNSIPCMHYCTVCICLHTKFHQNQSISFWDINICSFWPPFWPPFWIRKRIKGTYIFQLVSTYITILINICSYVFKNSDVNMDRWNVKLAENMTSLWRDFDMFQSNIA